MLRNALQRRDEKGRLAAGGVRTTSTAQYRRLTIHDVCSPGSLSIQQQVQNERLLIDFDEYERSCQRCTIMIRTMQSDSDVAHQVQRTVLPCTVQASACLFVCLFVCLFGCLVVWLFVCLVVCLMIVEASYMYLQRRS